MSNRADMERERYQRPGESDKARLGDLVYTWDSGYATGAREALRWAWTHAKILDRDELLAAIEERGKRYADR